MFEVDRPVWNQILRIICVVKDEKPSLVYRWLGKSKNRDVTTHWYP